MSDQLAPEWAQLSGFQRDLLVVICSLERAGETCYGLAIKSEIEDAYPDVVTHGRLYQNLDKLAERGFLEKRALDRRTNEYAITSDGTALLAAHGELLTELAGS